MAETIYILMGANLGDRERNLAVALKQISEMEGIEVTAVSSIYESEPVEMKDSGPSFLNQVVKCEYQYLPSELLDSLERIEVSLGRTDKGSRLSRTIDLDILFFGAQHIVTPRITVPHKDILKRPFSLVPLLQIDPDFVHPISKKPLAGYLSAIARHSVKLFKDYVEREI
ncbi:MAG: 2-amino-4-hydroxy-6-hydroxymethyldihydropteridine diphosphokinase [Candidatus Zixiibacteriota bacterium]